MYSLKLCFSVYLYNILSVCMWYRPEHQGCRKQYILWKQWLETFKAGRTYAIFLVSYLAPLYNTVEPVCKVSVLSNENWPYKRADLISGLLISIRVLWLGPAKNLPYKRVDLTSVDHISGLDCTEIHNAMVSTKPWHYAFQYSHNATVCKPWHYDRTKIHNATVYQLLTNSHNATVCRNIMEKLPDS